MKNFNRTLFLLKFSFFLFISISTLNTFAQNSNADTIKVLAIGNSFSQDAVEQYLYELAQAEGKTMVIGDLCIGGCTLEKHLNNALKDFPNYSYCKIMADGKDVKKKTSIKDALNDEQWDFISLQQASALSGLYETYKESLPALVKYVKSHLSKQAVLMLHQTWAYATDATHTGFKNYNNSQEEMYRDIVNAVEKAAALVGISKIIPSGTAVQNVRNTWVGDNMNRDGYHLDLLLGRYTAACTWFEALTHLNVVGNPYHPDGMKNELIKIAQSAAHSAVKNPNKVTKMKTMGQNRDSLKQKNTSVPILSFNHDGKFKIAQFTDLHLNGEKLQESLTTYQTILDVLNQEKPDLAIFTGDIVCCGKNAVYCLKKLFQLLEEHQTPFAFVFGNHDAETDISPEDFMKLAKNYKYNLAIDENPDLYGTSNYSLSIMTADKSKLSFCLYCFDSNRYSQIEHVEGYDYIHTDQINWYKQKSMALNENNDTPIPALAFFHIPLPEYKEATSGEDTNFYGAKNEPVASPQINSGLFTAMLEQKDVIGIFVGHEHDNDFIVGWKSVALAYGRFSGNSKTTYGALKPGARMIELTENQRQFKSWIRTADGIEQITTYPQSFWKAFKQKNK